MLKTITDNPLLKDRTRGLLTGKGSGFKQLRAAGRGVELSVLPKWSSFGQVSAKFSHKSPTSFWFLATGSVLLSLGPKMNSWEGMSSYYVYCPVYIIKITCCSYMKLYPNVINRDFPLSSLNFARYWRWKSWPVILSEDKFIILFQIKCLLGFEATSQTLIL